MPTAAPHERRLWRLLLPAAILLIAGAATLWLFNTGPEAKPRPRTRTATLVEIRPVVFGPQTTRVAAMGTVRPSRAVELKPQVGGEIVEMDPRFVPGGRFRRGEVMLRIDPADYRLAVRQLASEVARAEAELQLEQGNQLVARKEYELLGEAVSAEEESLMLRQPQLESSHAALEAARARLAQAQLDLDRTAIAAPFNAVVESREVNLGTRVNSASNLGMLVGTDSYWVEVAVPVSQLAWIRVPRTPDGKGSSVRIFDRAAWGEEVFRSGRVIGQAATVETQGRMAQLLVEVPDPLALRPENAGLPRMLIDAYVRVEIEGEELPQAAALERDLVRDGESAWVMDSEDRLDIRRLEIAFRGPEEVLVTGGLATGERLVISNLPAPVQGMPLRLPETAADETAGESAPR